MVEVLDGIALVLDVVQVGLLSWLVWRLYQYHR